MVDEVAQGLFYRIMCHLNHELLATRKAWNVFDEFFMRFTPQNRFCGDPK